MSPSELDNKAPSVQPRPFKVGDRVWINRFGLRPNERAAITSIPIDHSGRFQVSIEHGGREWCTPDEIFFDTSPSTPPNVIFKSADEQIKELGALAKHLPLNDAVNHPNHYTAGTLETIDAIEAMVGQAGWSPATGYRLGNVLKYLWRHAHKGGLESLKKARWYLDREIAAVEKAALKAQEKP